MSRQPFQLTDFGSQESDDSESDESIGSTTVEGSTNRHVALVAKPVSGNHCDICHLASMECDWREFPDYPYEYYSRIRSSALAGRRCCSLFVDAIETWLFHANHKAYKAVHLGSGLLFDTLEVLMTQYWSREVYRNGRYTVNPRVYLRWQAASDDDSIVPVALFVFAPYGMQKQAATHYIVLNDRVDTPPQHATIASEFEFSRRHLPSGDTASLQAFQCLENWITTCVHSHSKCNASIPGYTPKRVLEIKQHGIVLRENLSKCIRYACLSHCWGGDGVAFKLTSANLGTLKHGIEPSVLPKTFRDAVEICSRLQIHYLWIDALCMLLTLSLKRNPSKCS
jgi:hypothetical protein